MCLCGWWVGVGWVEVHTMLDSWKDIRHTAFSLSALALETESLTVMVSSVLQLDRL